jgi:hypothetical protein
MANYIKLEWRNSCDIGRIYYQAGFSQHIFLDAGVGAPAYNQNFEEAGEDGNGVVILDYMKLEKVYKIQCYVPEYLLDALQLLSMHDDIMLSYTNGLFSSAIRNVVVDSEWAEESNQCMALATISFQMNDQVVKNSCCNNL